MFRWLPDFEDRLNNLPPELYGEVVQLLQALLEDPEIIYTKEEYTYTRRDDVGPRAVEITIKGASKDNVTIVVAFENGDVAGIFVKNAPHLTEQDIVDARKNYDETKEQIGSEPATWSRSIL